MSEVVKENKIKNMESKKNILEYLKSINVNSYNKHEEIEKYNYIASIVIITTNTTTLDSKVNEYEVYLLFQDKNDNKIYGKFYSKEFNDKIEAETYYNNLKDKVNSITENEIHNLI
jgi:hypothetical protein